MTLCRQVLCLPILVLAASLSGCQTNALGQLSCADQGDRVTLCGHTLHDAGPLSCGADPGCCDSGCGNTGCGNAGCGDVECACGQEPLIIFIGADRDIAKMGQLEQVTEDFKSCGYNAEYFDPWKQLNDPEALACMIRKAVRCRGQRVMLVGWSYGTIVGLKALEIVRQEGICVDTFVELDCFNLCFYMGEHFHPANAGRVVVIRSRLNQPVEGYCRPAAYRLTSMWHLGVPTNDHTRRLLFCEANRLRIACSQHNLAQSQPVVPPIPVAPYVDTTRSANASDSSDTAR